MKEILNNKRVLKRTFRTPIVGKDYNMFFFFGGITTTEKIEVMEVTDEFVFLARGSTSTWQFSRKTGKCLNDNTFMGARRFIKPCL